MESTAASAPSDVSQSWVFRAVTEAIQRALAVFAMAALLGGLLYYTWPVLAPMFSFLDPINGYWNYVLAVLGAYGVFYLYRVVRDGTSFELDLMGDDMGTLQRALVRAVEPGALLLVAWLIVEYIR